MPPTFSQHDLRYEENNNSKSKISKQNLVILFLGLPTAIFLGLVAEIYHFPLLAMFFIIFGIPVTILLTVLSDKS